MNYCDGCVDYDHETQMCVPSGEAAGPAVVYCKEKRLYLTKGDKIRDMTDEELAEWFLKNAVCPCVAVDEGCALNDDTCKQAWLSWLEEKAE